MAAPICGRLGRLRGIFLRFPTKYYRQEASHRLGRCISSTLSLHGIVDSTSGVSQDPAPLFLDARVQEILQRVTGFDLARIFSEIPADPEPPKYRLLTQEQLQKLQEETERKAQQKLTIPPVMNPRKDSEEIISDDPEIAGLETSNYIFTDITYGFHDRERTIVVREPGGKLRAANWKERDHANQVFFPSPGRMYNIPTMFEEASLERVLGEHRYLYVLNRACIQFEPDDPEFIRITNRTYEHIASQGQFDLLRSTRYFGCMTFYLAFHKNIDRLLVDMVQRDLLSDGADTVLLYHILHPGCRSAEAAKQNNVQDQQQLIQLFAKLDAREGGVIELALQSYNDAHNRTTSAATT